jgi:hypothetical protein
MTTMAFDRKRKSEKLSAEDFKALRHWVNAQPTIVDAALIIGIKREVLSRVLIVKSGSPETIGKILSVLRQDKQDETVGAIK